MKNSGFLFYLSYQKISECKVTQYKKLAPNALRFTYQNLKSCEPHEKTKQKTSKSIGEKLKT